MLLSYIGNLSPLKRVNSLSKRYCLFIIILFVQLGVNSFAANRFAVASGNWNAAIWATTSGGVAGSAATPTSSDDVTINTTRSVTVNVAAGARSLTINGTLIFSGTPDLTIANSGSLTVNNGALIQFSSGGLIRGGGNNASGILVDINAGATLETANAQGFVTGTGNTVLTGSIAIKPGNRGAPQYDAGVNYIYDGTVAQVTGSAITSAAGLTISNSVGVSASNNLTVTTLTTGIGRILIMGTNTLSVTNVNHSGTLRTANVSAAPISAGKTWGGLVQYNSASAQTIAYGNYNDLDGTGGNRTLSQAGTIGIAGDFTVGSGTYTITNSIVDFNGLGEQIIPAFTFDNLLISNAGIKKIPGSIAVNCQTITINNGGSVEINADGGGALNILN